MSIEQFRKKVFDGESTTPEDWAQYLKELHAAVPGCTPLAFANLKIAEGKTSYQLLAETARVVEGSSEPLVVDLACGDGHFVSDLRVKLGEEISVVGIDMSAGELTLARNKWADSKTEFREESAQKLSLKSESVDAIFCHMAFMLMTPIEPVVSEIVRVLKPQGLFAAVVGHQSGGQGRFLEIQKIIGEFMHSRYPKLNLATGDPRSRTPEGWSQLFGLKGGEISVFDFHLIVKLPVDRVWDTWMHTYLIALLPDQERAALGQEVTAFAKSAADSSGQVIYEFPMRRMTIQKN